MEAFSRRWTALAVAVGVLLIGMPAQAKTEIHFWHAMTGQLGTSLEAQAKQFNESQGEYEVKPLRKGNYAQTLTAAIAAYRQKNPPHIVQVFEVGTQTMLMSGAVYPVYDLMKHYETPVKWNDFIKPVVGYYTKDGKLYSMPYNSSTPIFYYNKDAFKKAGLAPDKPPKTWKDVEAYGGRGGAADPKFVNGDCAMYVQSSALIGGFTRGVKFDWGTGELPHWGAPYRKATSIIGGATLWVLKGKPEAEYRGVARFLEFLAKPEQEMGWHVNTGYLAISNTAVRNLEQGYHFVRNPKQYTAFAQLTGLPPTPPAAMAGKKAAPAKAERVATANSSGLRLGNFVQIRDVIESEMENIFAGKKSAKQGLDDAVAKSNALLKDFAATYKQ